MFWEYLTINTHMTVVLWLGLDCLGSRLGLPLTLCVISDWLVNSVLQFSYLKNGDKYLPHRAIVKMKRSIARIMLST